jgi:hypothetical protein
MLKRLVFAGAVLAGGCSSTHVSSGSGDVSSLDSGGALELLTCRRFATTPRNLTRYQRTLRVHRNL